MLSAQSRKPFFHCRTRRQVTSRRSSWTSRRRLPSSASSSNSPAPTTSISPLLKSSIMLITPLLTSTIRLFRWRTRPRISTILRLSSIFRSLHISNSRTARLSFSSSSTCGIWSLLLICNSRPGNQLFGTRSTPKISCNSLKTCRQSRLTPRILRTRILRTGRPLFPLMIVSRT